jgi:hypothetical protein
MEFSLVYDDKMVSTRLRGLDLERSKIVTDFNSWMGGVDLSGAYLTSCLSLSGLMKSTSAI